MKRIYSIESNVFSNAAETDSVDDVAKWIKDNLVNMPFRAIINIRVREVIDELWMAQPNFEGFIHVPEQDRPGSD